MALVMVLALAPAAPVRAAPHQPRGDKGLQVTADRQTTRASVRLTGRTRPRTVIRVDGGVLPVTLLSAPDGAFDAEVLLRPSRRNALTVTAWPGRRPVRATLSVKQVMDNPQGVVSGRVVDIGTGTPVAGATVHYGRRTAVTDAQGTYRITGVPEGLAAITGRAAGHLTGLAVASVQDGRATARDLFVQRLAAPVRVGPAGGSFAGTGWRVQIPAGRPAGADRPHHHAAGVHRRQGRARCAVRGHLAQRPAVRPTDHRGHRSHRSRAQGR
ncbi:MAG TPA: carboxypeptidase regulatory-like domain-containing protein [Actinoplanes sp.]